MLECQLMLKAYRYIIHAKPLTAFSENPQCQLMLNAHRYFTPMGRGTSDACRTFFSSSASIHTTLKRVAVQTSTIWDDDRRRAELVSVSPVMWYQTVWRSSHSTLVSDRPAVRRLCFDCLTSLSRRATSFGRTRHRDDTRASSSSPASFSHAHIDDRGRTVSRQLRRRSRSRRRLNDRHPLYTASKELYRCRPCRTPADGRSAVKRLEKLITSGQSSRFWATRTSDLFKRANVAVAPAAAALPLKPLTEWRNTFMT